MLRTWLLVTVLCPRAHDCFPITSHGGQRKVLVVFIFLIYFQLKLKYITFSSLNLLQPLLTNFPPTSPMPLFSS